MLGAAARVADVQDHLPEIFEEGSLHRIQAGIVSTGALRYFVVVDGATVGRTELTKHLNDDPSIVPRIPEGITLGHNTCYFFNPSLLNRAHGAIHKGIADASIRMAFTEGDFKDEASPWLPVSLDGTDVSRGWLMQGENPGYIVIGDEPRPGIFPQFGIGYIPYSIQYATPRKSQT